MNTTTLRVLVGDVREQLRSLPDVSIHCVVTSPPYWALRDYGVPGQIGQEATPEAYVAALVEVFRDVRRVLRPDGTVWLNLGDTYVGSGDKRHTVDTRVPARQGQRQARNQHVAGLAPKNLLGMPWRVAFALQAEGWIVRSDIIWYKTNSLPESVQDRPTRSHEHVFLLTRSPHYYFDWRAIATPYTATTRARLTRRQRGAIPTKWHRVGVSAFAGHRPPTILTTWNVPRLLTHAQRRPRDVWMIPTGHKGAGDHVAPFPPRLIAPMIQAGCRRCGTVYDPISPANPRVLGTYWRVGY